MTTLSPSGESTPLPAGTGTTRARATMRDVAAHAGVGIKTVSRVVNGQPGVSAELVARVRASARELRYQPDMGAGSLRRADRRSNSIGLLLASVDNPFAALVHRAVEDVAERRGAAVFSASTDERAERERTLVAAFTSRRVDGLIITGTGADQAYLEPELQAGTPIVMIDRPPIGISVDHVVADNESGAWAATAHLLARGHRRIAFLGDLSGIATAAQRLRGFRRACHEAAVGAYDAIVVGDLRDERSAYEATARLLRSDNPPTAVFASQNLITIGAFRALRAHGAHRTIALVGFDDFSLADLLEPPVTVVTQDPGSIGRVAAERLFARLMAPALPVEQIVVGTTLIPRGSGEILPSRGSC